MQIAGEICQLCERLVESEVEATACRHCGKVFHRGCLAEAAQVCAACGQDLYAPPSSTSQPTAFSDSRWHFAEHKLERPKTSLLYRISLAVVCAAMILLPAIYLSLIGITVFAVVSHAIRLPEFLNSGPVNQLGVVILFPIYVAPILGGMLLTLFLVKPLFAPRRKPAEVFSIDHADAPQLFALIGWICRSLGAPAPRRVDLNCTVNAAASLQGGWRNIFKEDAVLSIGLPLAAGLSLGQFAGVLAHEYGHLAQGIAMRADGFITRINRWFYDAVFEPDEWDLYLREKCNQDDEQWLLRIVFYALRAGFAITRGVLWILMVMGSAFSSLLSRQMEFDADQHELKVSGSETFVSTTLRLQQLSLGLALAQKQMVTKWKKERKLFDRIADYIVCRADEISANTQEQYYARVFRRKTGVFDQHPSDAERTKRARDANEPGVFHDATPATSLFTDYPELSRRLTLFFYRNLIGPAFTASSLVSMEQKKAQVEHNYAADRANVRRHFGGIAMDSRPLFLAESKSLTCRPQEILGAELLECRERMEEMLPAARGAAAAHRRAETNLLRAQQAAQLLAAGFQFDPTNFGMRDNDAERAKATAREELEAASTILEEFEAAGKLRLLDAVQLLPLPYIAAKISGAVKLQDDARELIHVLSRVSEFFGPMLELKQNCALMEVLLEYRHAQPGADNAAAALENLCVEIQEGVNAIQEHTSQMRYPFDHATERVMLGDFLRNTEYHADPCEMALREGRSHTEGLLDICNRLLGNLIVICEQVEERVGDLAKAG